ncbi:acetate/propionate family kinase, partial [Motilibacter sp. E257]|nr:acetate/propionate family kinase [Motilibacter deserti]
MLVVNAGSSSLKLSLLDERDDLAAESTLERWEGARDTGGIEKFLADLGTAPAAVAHRFVHGGARTDAALLDDREEQRLTELTALAPLHQPRSLAGVAAVRRALPQTPTYACFDTAFHATLPEAARTYALPAQWREQWGLQRYGFHGLSHAYAARRAAQLLGRPADELRLVTCHLGSGSSLCAVRAGRSVDTTMGFTPSEGLVMRTRSGTVDPGLMLWLLQEGGLTVDRLAAGIERGGGLAGLSGTSGDTRDIAAAAAAGDQQARLALDVWNHRLRRELGAMIASAGGVDAVVLTGGIGEHAPGLVDLSPLEALGLAVDTAAVADGRGDR